MDNKEDKLDYLLNKLSRQEPELKDAGLLTDSIMNAIRHKSHRQAPPVLMWIRAVSSVAAILLIGLFLFQQNDPDTIIASTNKPIIPVEKKIDIDPTCIQQRSNKQVNLIATYFCYMQQHSIKNNQLRSITQPVTN